MLGDKWNADQAKDMAVFAVMRFTVIGLVLMAIFSVFNLLYRVGIFLGFAIGILICAVVAIFKGSQTG